MSNHDKRRKRAADEYGNCHFPVDLYGRKSAQRDYLAGIEYEATFWNARVDEADKNAIEWMEMRDQSTREIARLRSQVVSLETRLKTAVEALEFEQEYFCRRSCSLHSHERECARMTEALAKIRGEA